MQSPVTVRIHSTNKRRFNSWPRRIASWPYSGFTGNFETVILPDAKVAARYELGGGFTGAAAATRLVRVGSGASGFGAPVNSAIPIAGVFVLAESPPLRRTNWIVPWFSARANFSDSSGVTSSV